MIKQKRLVKRFDFTALKQTTVSTLYIIALFMLVTMGLPLVIKSPYLQVGFYAGLAAVLGYKMID